MSSHGRRVTHLFFAWPLEFGSALRCFLGAGCSGLGVARGLADALTLLSLALEKTALIAGVGVVPFAGCFSTFRLLGAGVIVASGWPEIPSPTLAGDSPAAAFAAAGFLLAGCFLVAVSLPLPS